MYRIRPDMAACNIEWYILKHLITPKIELALAPLISKFQLPTLSLTPECQLWRAKQTYKERYEFLPRLRVFFYFGRASLINCWQLPVGRPYSLLAAPGDSARSCARLWPPKVLTIITSVASMVYSGRRPYHSFRTQATSPRRGPKKHRRIETR